MRVRLGTKTLGMFLLALWLILTGLFAVASFPSASALLGLLAVAAGVLILLGR